MNQSDIWTIRPEQQTELERRAAEHRQNPDDGFTWDEVKASLENRIDSQRAPSRPPGRQ